MTAHELRVTGAGRRHVDAPRRHRHHLAQLNSEQFSKYASDVRAECRRRRFVDCARPCREVGATRGTKSRTRCRLGSERVYTVSNLRADTCARGYAAFVSVAARPEFAFALRVLI
jgi:hypothetical protein